MPAHCSLRHSPPLFVTAAQTTLLCARITLKKTQAHFLTSRPCFGGVLRCALQLKLEIRPKARAAVSKALLVGGATRMPAVKRFLENMTGVPSRAAS